MLVFKIKMRYTKNIVISKNKNGGINYVSFSRGNVKESKGR